MHLFVNKVGACKSSFESLLSPKIEYVLVLHIVSVTSVVEFSGRESTGSRF